MSGRRPRRHARYGRVPPRDPLRALASILLAALLVYAVVGVVMAILTWCDW